MSAPRDPATTDPLGSPLARAAFEAATEGLLVLAPDGTVLALNGAFARLYGLDAATQLGRPYTDFAEGLEVRQLDGLVGQTHRVTPRALEGERIEPVLQTIRNVRTGQEFVARFVATPFAADGRFVATIVTVKDVTERYRAEAEASRAADRYRALAEAAATVVFAADAGGALTEIPLARGLYERDRGTGLGDGWLSAVHPEDQEAAVAVWVKAITTGEPYTAEFRVRMAEGGYRWHAARGVRVVDQDGTTREWVGALTDVHERAEAARELRESADQSRQIAEGLPQIVWSAGADGMRDYFNARWLEYTGVGFAESEDPWLSALHSNDAERALGAWWSAVGSGETFQAEYRLRARDGRFRWFLGRAIALRNEEGEIVRWFGTCTDIDEQKADQRVLEIAAGFARTLASDLDAQRIVQALTDASTEAVGAEFGSFFYAQPERELGPDGDLRFGLYVLSGAPPEAFAGFPPVRVTELFAPTFRGEGTVRSDDVVTDPRFRGMPPGHLPVRSYLAVTVRGRDGAVLGGLLFGHSEPGRFDEERERLVESFAAQASVAYENAILYERLREAKDDLELRVESRTAELTRANRDLNEFSYSVAHDLRAPLRAIVSTSKILLEDEGDRLTEEGRAALERQATVAQRLARIVDDLLGFARLAKADLRREPFDLTELARRVAEEVASRRRDSREVRVQEGLRALGDPSLVGYALTNLLDNALKFSPKGGTVTVDESEGAFFVRDEGVGFDMRHAGKLFTAFERLVGQEAFEGTGVGLANVKRIVERHGGRVWAESEPGQGATFWFTLG